mmetsp:Transcript_11223/g.31259  ORF Transcript_11223/g.31259 Transcript_11223/m.31259 type:complete len:97 (+) Transcript_11223:145-435(+)
MYVSAFVGMGCVSSYYYSNANLREVPKMFRSVRTLCIVRVNNWCTRGNRRPTCVPPCACMPPPPQTRRCFTPEGCHIGITCWRHLRVASSSPSLLP